VLNQQQITSLGLRFPTIAGDAALMGELAAAAVAASLPRGQSICREGDTCHQLALLTSGSARIFKTAESGREITLYRVEPGECCILTASCMLSDRAFPANAVVEGHLEAVVIPEPQVLQWMASSPSWRQFMWSLLAERLADVIGLVEEIAFRRMDERLREYLAEHARDKGPVLHATHSQVAADLGTSREVVSRMLKDLELRGLLRLSRGRIELGDPEALLSAPAV
jgi:CRP/FNR family transcriptional regulator